MNLKQRTINESLKALDKSFHYKEGVIKFSKHETFKHFLGKCLFAWELKQNDLDYICEAKFSNGKIADFYVLSWKQASEIMASEKEASIKIKEEEYPVPVKGFKADDIIKQNKIIIGDGQTTHEKAMILDCLKFKLRVLIANDPEQKSTEILKLKMVIEKFNDLGVGKLE